MRTYEKDTAAGVLCALLCAELLSRTPLRAHSKATDGVTAIARRLLCIGVYLTCLRWTQAAIRVTAQQRRAPPTTRFINEMGPRGSLAGARAG